MVDALDGLAGDRGVQRTTRTSVIIGELSSHFTSMESHKDALYELAVDLAGKRGIAVPLRDVNRRLSHIDALIARPRATRGLDQLRIGVSDLFLAVREAIDRAAFVERSSSQTAREGRTWGSRTSGL